MACLGREITLGPKEFKSEKPIPPEERGFFKIIIIIM